MFDTGATTSFISQQFVETFGIRCQPLEVPITVLSAGGKLLVTQVKMDQVIMICDGVYDADLLVIPMKDIAVILGMDWLLDHGAQIDCEEKTISLRGPGGLRTIYQGDKHSQLREDLQLNSMKDVKIEKIPLVKYFQDVFPEELPGMPLDR